MATQFTGNPVDVSPTTQVLTEQSTQGGFYTVGSSLYLVIGNTFGSPIVSVFKSTDAGATWAEKDVANHPSNGVPGGLSSVLDPTTGVIHIVFRNTGAGGSRYIQFNTGTDTYGASVLNAGYGSAGGAQIVRLSTGELWTYTDDPTNAKINRAQIIASVWQATQVIYNNGGAGNPQASYPKVVIDSNDTAHVVFVESPSPFNPGDLFNLKTFRITKLGVISGVTTIASEAYNGGAFGPFAIGTPIITFGNTVLIPNLNTAINNPNNVTNMYLGTPLAAPVWTTKLVRTGLDPTFDDSGVFALAYSDSLAYIFWVYIDNNAQSKFQVYYATYDGTTVSAPILYWDAVANPALPVGSPSISGQALPLVLHNSGYLIMALSAGFNVNQATTFVMKLGIAIPSLLPAQCTTSGRLCIFDDGAGMTLADMPLSNILAAGANGVPFLLPSPMVVTKPGLVTVSITNTQLTNVAWTNHVMLMFAVPKKCRNKERAKI